MPTFVRHSKRSVIERTEREYRALDRLVRRLRPTDFRRRVFGADAPVPWTVKDVLAHIVVWKEAGRRSLARQRHMPELRGTVESQRNLQIYRAWRHRKAAEIVATHREVHRNTMATLQALPEERFSGLLRHPEWPRTLGGHCAEHRAPIEAIFARRSVRDQEFTRSTTKTRRVAATSAEHTAIRSLVARIRRETRRPVPDVDPNGPGARAKVAMVLLTPGPAEGGAQMTGVLSPTTDSDQTALNLRHLMREAKLREDVCVFWNAIPWALERRRNPTDDELARGVAYLKEFLGLLPKRRAVVALGRVAQAACRRAGVAVIDVWSPSPLAVAPPGARPSVKAQRWVEVREGLRRAAARAVR